jgi:hypothetical protein
MIPVFSRGHASGRRSGSRRWRAPTFYISRRLFLSALGLIYGIAFLSLGSQLNGLIGRDGIVPAASFLDSLSRSFGPERFHYVPTLAWISAGDGFLRALCDGGVVLSILLILGIAPALVLFLLWIGYLSLSSIGGVFLQFQWDALLLETGFLAIFLAPLGLRPASAWRRPPSRWVVFLFAFLLFKLMFSSGVVKLSSGDPTWRHLTALSYHYETQPLPSWVSWYAYQLPAGFHKAATAVLLLVELVVPFFVFGPRRLRHAAGLALIGLQLVIALTGNYGFFNLLTIALCLLLFDDSFWPRGWRVRARFLRFRRPNTGPRWPAGVLVPVGIVLLTVGTMRIAGSFRQPIPWPRPLVALERALAPFQIANGYGLFAVMTTSRPEIIVEGSSDGVRWEPYEFKYKMGDLRRRPKILLGHMPRLDWQMWFAALGGGRQVPWFRSFCVRLLQGDPAVTNLLERDPFAGHPPRFIRSRVYDYRFTSVAERKAGEGWWKRELEGQYLPAFSLGNTGAILTELRADPGVPDDPGALDNPGALDDFGAPEGRGASEDLGACENSGVSDGPDSSNGAGGSDHAAAGPCGARPGSRRVRRTSARVAEAKLARIRLEVGLSPQVDHVAFASELPDPLEEPGQGKLPRGVRVERPPDLLPFRLGQAVVEQLGNVLEDVRVLPAGDPLLEGREEAFPVPRLQLAAAVVPGLGDQPSEQLVLQRIVREQEQAF